MLKTAFLVISAVIVTASLYLTYMIWNGSGQIVPVLDAVPAKRLYLTGLIVNCCLLLANVLLLLIVPGDRRILYGAFTTLMGIFSLIVLAQTTGFFARPFEFSYDGFQIVSAQGNPQVTSAALVVTALLLIACWRELKDTPPEQNA